MRSFLLSAIAVTVLASSAVALSTAADAATRRPQHRAATPPIVRQDPYSAYNTFGAPGADAFHTQRNVHPISGTPRWNAAGGAP